MKPKELIDLQLHCAKLSSTLFALWEHDPVTYENNEEILEFNDAAEWLDIAAGISKVDLLTSRFDDSLAYCETAMEYETARSTFLSRLVTRSTIFLFVWGAYETVAKMIDLPSIPPEQRIRGADSLVDRTIYYIRSAELPCLYIEILENLKQLLSQYPRYKKENRFKKESFYLVPSGEGLDLVRGIRNKFAHGNLSFPLTGEDSDGWNGLISKEPSIIDSSSRIVLFTIQMLLSVYYKDSHFKLHIMDIVGNSLDKKDIHCALEKLHLSL